MTALSLLLLLAVPLGAQEASLEDLRLSNNLYFQALREYRSGRPSLALAKLDVALALNPQNAEAAAARARLLQEARRSPAPSRAGPVPSRYALRRSYDLYFEALRRYGLGDLRGAHDRLADAARLDPGDAGVANALGGLRRELAAAR